MRFGTHVQETPLLEGTGLVWSQGLLVDTVRWQLSPFGYSYHYWDTVGVALEGCLVEVFAVHSPVLKAPFLEPCVSWLWKHFLWLQPILCALPLYAVVVRAFALLFVFSNDTLSSHSPAVCHGP